ncbi:MAG: TolC family protein [Polyangia bacterium]|jgi:outer membrane protein
MCYRRHSAITAVLAVFVPLYLCGFRASAQENPAAHEASPPANPARQLSLSLPPGRVITLREAIDLALRVHPSELQARANVDVTAARVEEARSGYLPQVSASAIYERTTGNVAIRPGFNTSQGSTSTTGAASATPLPSTSWNPSFNSYNFTASAAQLIYDFGQTSGRWRASEETAASAVSSEKGVQIQLVSNVRRAYFQARAQKDLIVVAAHNLLNQERHLEQIVGLVEQGMRPEIDRVTAETNVANARVQLISAQNNFAVACATLGQTIGVSAGASFLPADDEMGPVPEEGAPLDRLLALALQQRPEVASFEEQRRAQEQTIRSALGGYGPAVSAQASLNEQGIALESTSSRPGLEPNWWAGVVLTWQLYQGGLTAGQVREARATLRSIAAQEEAFKLQVRVDVETASLAVKAARETLDAAQIALQNSGKQLELAESRYGVGMGSVIELGDSQVTETTAEAQVVNARYNLAGARAALLGALGRQ